jgi:hypothetical protein
VLSYNIGGGNFQCHFPGFPAERYCHSHKRLLSLNGSAINFVFRPKHFWETAEWFRDHVSDDIRISTDPLVIR